MYINAEIESTNLIAKVMAGMWNTKWALVSDPDVGHTRTDYNCVIASGRNAQTGMHKH